MVNLSGSNYTALFAANRMAVAALLSRTAKQGWNVRDNQIAVWALILTTELADDTAFMYTLPEQNMYISLGLNQQILPIFGNGMGSDAWHAYVHQRYGLAETEPSAKLTYSLIKHYCINYGQKVELRRFVTYRTATQTLYMSNYDGTMWKLDGSGAPLRLTNGEEGVFFADDDRGAACDDLNFGGHGKLLDTLTDLSFAAAAPGGITPKHQRQLLIIWLFMIAFPDLMPTKPLLIVEGSPGSGKCLQKGTLVLRYDGQAAPVEAVRVGDLLMGPDSRPRRVLGTTTGRGELYKVTPTTGEAWVCNDQHILTLVASHKGKVIDIPVKEFAAASTYVRGEYKQFMPKGVDFPPNLAPLPIDPYFLGVWYGDGSKSLTGVHVTKPDPEIQALMDATAKAWNLKLRINYKADGQPTYSISAGNGGKVGKNKLLVALRAVVGEGTYLPHAYLTGTRIERTSFLAGLLDTDGYLGNGCFEIVQKQRGFADGICFLARSLGLRATLAAPKYVVGYANPYWRVSISGDMTCLPLRLPRKQPKPRRQCKDVTRTGLTVASIGIGEYAGFELDGDGRFLLGDFTVTHNSSSLQLIQLALMGKIKPMIVQRNKEDDFGVTLLRSPIAVLDNLDSYIEWIPDAVCAYATAGFWTKRKLYANDTEYTIRPHAFIAVASKNPASFRREDVADRSLVVRLERRATFTPQQVLATKITEARGALLGEYLWYLDQIITELRAAGLATAADEAHRMADFSSFANVVAKVLGWPATDVADVLRAIQTERDSFVNEEDSLAELLHAWLSNKPNNGPWNIGREMSPGALFGELEAFALAKRLPFYKSQRMLVQKLRSPHLSSEFRIEELAVNGYRHYKIWRRTDAVLSIVPAVSDQHATKAAHD